MTELDLPLIYTALLGGLSAACKTPRGRFCRLLQRRDVLHYQTQEGRIDRSRRGDGVKGGQHGVASTGHRDSHSSLLIDDFIPAG